MIFESVAIVRFVFFIFFISVVRGDERSGMCDSRLPPNAVNISKTEWKSWDNCIDYVQTVYKCIPQLNPTAPMIRQKYCLHEPKPLKLGAEIINEAEFPHIAYLGYDDRSVSIITWECMASLISDRWLVTAASCLNDERYGVVKYVQFGFESTKIYPITKMVKHPKYAVPKYHLNDIALLQLKESVQFSDYIRPACLHVGSYVDDRLMMALGFNFQDSLLKIVLQKYPTTKCGRYNLNNHPGHGVIDGLDDKIQICAGLQTGKITCKEYRGSPLQVYNQHLYCLYTLLGVSSFSRGCGTDGVDSIYTKILPYVPWIENVVW